MSWQLGSSIVLALALLAAFAWYERERPPSRVVALVAALAALAVVGRVAFAAFPNVKPTTDIVLFAGYALGALPGFAVGAVTALVSNLFFGQGPWTVWQMAGWGGVGAAAALLARMARRRELGRVPLALACGVAGLAFGAWMDLYQWTLAARQDLDSYLAVSLTSLPYNLAHAVGNVLFCLVIGPVFVRSLRRYRRRLEVSWRPAAAVAGALAAVLVAGGAAAPPAQAASAGSKAASYLLRAQNRDGGFPAARGGRSDQLMTGWSALGLAATGRNPRDVRRRGGRSAAGYLTRSSGALRDIGEIERTVLVLRAAGLPANRFRGRNLLAEITRRRRSDGSISGFVSYSAFGVLALRSAGARESGATIRYLLRAQNEDGGYGLTATAASDVDLTGAALQALAAAGRTGGGASSRAVAYLRGRQNPDGGFGARLGQTSNSQSTAYAALGLLAARSGGAAANRAMAYLARMQRPDGSIRYSRTSAQTPVWVTAQALLALSRRPLPLRPVARRERPAAAASGAAAGGRGGSSKAGGRDGAAARTEPGVSPEQERSEGGTAPAPGQPPPPAGAAGQPPVDPAAAAKAGLATWQAVAGLLGVLALVLLARYALDRSMGLRPPLARRLLAVLPPRRATTE